MKKTGIIGFSALLILLSSYAVAAEELLLLQSPAVYDNPEVIPHNIFAKCTDLPKTLSHSLAEMLLKERYARVRGIDEITPTTQGKALGLRILSVAGRRGGGATGSKYLSLRANLYQDGSLVAWREFKLTKETSILDSGTCKILNHAAAQLAGEILKWMKRYQGRYELNATLAKNVPATEDMQPTDQLDPDDTMNISEITRVSVAKTAEYGESQSQARQLMEACGLDSKTGELMHATFVNRLQNVVEIDSNTSKGLTLRYKILTSDDINSYPDGNGTLTLEAELWRDNASVDTHSETFIPKKPVQKWRWIQPDAPESQSACNALNVASKYLTARTYRWYASRFNPIVKKAD